MKSMAVSNNTECTQWLSVTEETLFLHDGLLRVTDLVELPKDVEACGSSRDNEVVSFDSKIPEELSARLIELCGIRNNAFSTLQEYRLNALKGLWRAHRSLNLNNQGDGEENNQEDSTTIALLKKQGLIIKDSDQASFSTRISLLLILPLLQSQSKTDPQLCAVTSGVILTCLRDCPPLSLAKEPSDCLSGLESLLCGWLGEKNDKSSVEIAKDRQHQENAAAALVALACARGHVKTLIHTVHLLQQLPNIPPLPVADVLSGMLNNECGQGHISAFLGSKYIHSWGVDDLLGTPTTEVAGAESKESNDKDKDKDQDIGRSIATDGFFLFTTNNAGKGLAKIGSGHQGTLRGYVYCKNSDIGPGRIACAGATLLFRPQRYDLETENEYLAQLIDKSTLEVVKVVSKSPLPALTGPCTSVGFCSDGTNFYWIWCPRHTGDKNAKSISVNMTAFSLTESREPMPLRDCIVLQKKDEIIQKGVNEAILNRLRPLRGSNSAATLMALTGGETLISNRKEESSGVGFTTCGLLLKTLVKTPIHCDGNHLVMLTQTPGMPSGAGARSLFGGGGAAIGGIRSLASSMCFSVKTGFVSARLDLVDASASSLGRGSPPSSLGTCFDVVNNLLWISSGEYVDQFVNPGNLATHHIHYRLGISSSSLADNLPESNLVPVNIVINTLLQTVGSMCLHQMTGEMNGSGHASSASSTTNVQSGRPQASLDFEHLTRVTDILGRAVSDRDNQSVICCLVVLQLIFKASRLKMNDLGTSDQVRNTRSLVWKLLNSKETVTSLEHFSDRVKREACHVITGGLQSLYPTSQDRHALLYDLLTSGDENKALIQLRDMILTNFAGQLCAQQGSLENSGMLLLPDDLVSYVLKLAVKESCALLKQSQSCNKQQLQEKISELPIASPAVLYLASLRSYLLRSAILYAPKESDKEPPSGELSAIQKHVLALSSKMIDGACQVLESFLETCSTVLTTCMNGELESWLAGFERLAKSTILGTLMPVLITALTHPNLQSLELSQVMMPSLVSLSLLASQAVLLMKNEELAATTSMSTSNDLDMNSDKEMAELIGEALNTDAETNSDEEEGFLTGLKIPAPWASGKTVETIHPVRDNYKFKETVHIPGARCLYLRFDSRCSSQYDYDKVVIYAGASINGKKVVEYGGNPYGFGSRSVLGSGWPKDLVKVEGDTVTLTFEMRSGREHNTPDKAMWGFACTIRAQESAEEETPGLPFLSDFALGLSVVVCTQLAQLYQGSNPTQDEIDCHHLLKSRLLQRCVWKFEQSEDSKCLEKVCEEEVSKDTKAVKSPRLPRIKLPQETLTKLRKLSKSQPMKIRPTIKAAIHLDLIEEGMISAAVKHLGLTEAVSSQIEILEQEGEELFAMMAIMEETYRRFDTLVRQLQIMADLEKRWELDVEEKAVAMAAAAACETSEATTEREVEDKEPPFFHDFHLRENFHKDVAMLAFLKDVPMETDSEAVVNSLIEKFNKNVEDTKPRTAADGKNGNSQQQPEASMSKTKLVVSGILSRLDLLLHVSSVPVDAESALTRTLSHTQGFKGEMLARSDTDMTRPHLGFSRSMSAPVGINPDDSSFFRYQRWRQVDKLRRTTSILQDLVDDGDEDKPPHIIVIDQLFAFIGSDPLKTVSCSKFLKAAEERHNRGFSRKKALNHIKELLSAASRVGGATHLVAAVASVLRHGPKVEDLLCGGMVSEVREAFAEAMSSVVQLAARYPIPSASSISLLCTIPYTRAEEKCLVRSGLVHLLDKLCSLGSHRTSVMGAEIQSPRQKVSALAWAGFQVLASRCVKWEVEDGSQVEELEHSGLAKQVSMLLTHHLARATESIGNAMAGTEALQEVLSLLNNLSKSKMGKAILSQPACVSKLLSLLLDQRPSPKLVLIILQLCRVSLPLMNCDDCQEVELPLWGCQQLNSAHWSNAQPVSDPPAKIISLLLAKLGDFLVPGEQVLLSSRSSSQEVSAPGRGSKSKDMDSGKDSDVQRGRLSVFVHKREDQMSHDVIQFLLSSDNRPFRLMGNANVDKVVRLDREINKNGKAELTTEEAVNAFRKAYKWAQMGLVISTAPPSDTPPTDNTSLDKKKTASEVICKEKNSELIRSDPIRAFISGHVANAMAAEVIALLHNLLSSHSNSTAHTWSQAVQRVLANALSGLPVLLNSLDSLSSPRSPRWQSSNQLMSTAKLANAALCALGGFQETVKPGCEVKVTGEGVANTNGVVVSISEQNDIVNILLHTGKSDDCPEEPISSPTYSDTIKVPFSRVRPVRNELFNQYQADMSDAFLSAVKTVVLPEDESSSPINQALHSSGDGNAMANQICRVVGEIRTRTSSVLALYLQDIEFAKKFIEHCGYSLDMLKSLAKDCHTGSRLPILETHCQRLRMLYRDCAKPPPPPCRTNIRPSREMLWDLARPFPPSRASLFSHAMTAVMFLGDPSAGMGLPRGTMVYANQPIPKEAPSFYWEVEISSFGDTQVESGAVVSFGFAPPAEKKDGAWTNPVGTCLFLNTGKAVHYNGASLLQWRSVRLEVTLNAGDIAGIGWERTGDPTESTQNPKGQVYFTYNGQRLAASLDNVAGAMFPVVHIQKKNCRVKANFGARPFAYAEGQQHRDAAEAANDVLRDIRESFGHLPFHSMSDSESDAPESSQPSTPSEQGSRDSKTPPKTACKTAELPSTLKEYDVDASQAYKLLPCHNNFVVTGPDSLFSRPVEEDSDEETIIDESASEDHYALLVKAWEQKVFPVIRRRFRNEAERKDGLEQIRGALQLGMTDIARQTVEFLYEENGGIPLDLHLPTIDDIKEDLAKFTIDRVKKGTTVIIRTRTGNANQAATQLPKFAVRSMLKTFGLTGTVLDVDTANELVQVETYLRSEGVLVRFWYPLVMLEKPGQGMRKASITGGQTMDTSNIHIHRELLSSESALAKMYLRTAFLHLTDHCNSPAMEISSCSASLGSGMAACAATLQELDLENIQLLSEHLLRSPYTTGTLEAVSPYQTPALSQLSTVQQVSLPNLVYRDSLRLKRELAVAISRASSQGEDYLIELTNQLCMCLQTAPELFPYMAFPVIETKVSSDVHFPGAACILVSCVSSSEAGNKESPPYRAPWARISTYTGKRIKRCGQVTRQEVVCYPRDIHHTQTNTSDQYAPIIVPGDRLFVKIGVSPPPGITITLHALPPQFLLAVAYIETLVTETFGCGTLGCAINKIDRKCTVGDVTPTPHDCGQNNSNSRSSRSSSSRLLAYPGGGFQTDESSSPSLWSLENIVITPLIFMHLIEFLCGFVWKTDVPALMKEYMFHLLAQTLRILHYSESGCSSQLMKSSPRFSPIQALLTALPRELKKLYDFESKTMSKMTTTAGSGMGIGVTDSGRFSTYFHALMEACLAVLESVPLGLADPLSAPKDPSEVFTEDNPSCLSPDLSGVSSSGKKKRLKPKKERAAASIRRLSASEQRAASESLDVPEASPSSSTSQYLTQREDSTSNLPSPGSNPPSQMTSLCSVGSMSSNAATSSSSSSSQVNNPPVKASEPAWFTQAVSVSKILRYLTLKESRCYDEVKATVKLVAQATSTATAQGRLLVITGIPTYLDMHVVKKSIRKVCNSLGGVDREEIFIPVSLPTSISQNITERTSPTSPTSSQTDSTTSAESKTVAKAETVGLDSQSDSFVSPPSQGSSADVTANNSKDFKIKSKFIEGYAVISIPSKTKIELVKRAFLKTKWLNLTPGDDAESMEAPEENLNVHMVSQALLTEPEANTALESYLRYKLSGKVGLAGGVGEATNQVLTEIFYSCYFVDQPQQDSGDICLSKEQILNDAPENLLAVFFNTVRPSKKPLTEAVISVLRQYGFQRHSDKDNSPPLPDKGSKGKSGKKLSPRSLKEKQVLGVVEKWHEEKSLSAGEKDKKKDREEKREREKREKSPRKEGAVADMAAKEAKSLSKVETRSLTLEAFVQYCDDLSKQDLRAVWRGLLACGLDLHLERCTCTDLGAALQMMEEWTLEKDMSLVTLTNELCSQLAISSARLHAHEIHLTEAHLASEKFSGLQGIPPESIKLRFAFLQHLNNILEVSFLPLIDLRPCQLYSRSTSYILSQMRSLIFYDTKVNFINRILNASAKRRPDQAAPEITLNPIESIGTGEKSVQSSILCQSFQQLTEINSKNLSVRLASGGDPTYSFNVRMTGEEVHGTSGSFRHYLWQVARELQSTSTGLLIPSLNKGRWLVKPGAMTYSEENLLVFLGQLLGVTIRADIPLGLDLVSTVWKLIVGMLLDPSEDLKQADSATYSFMKKIEMVESQSELEAILGDSESRFVYTSLAGEEMEIATHGHALPVSWANRQAYMDSIKQLRMMELSSVWRMQAIIAGLSSLLPLQLLSLMSPWDMEMRTSGQAVISLDFLKAHTMYQVGLVESDPHIEYFWSALESFSQEELARFIKFACNQERVPQLCPCQEGGPDSAHVPPYPMKIAPPDGSGPPDSRYIRVETCMFMVKLPQYSSLEVMLQRLRYAINCREDPLSG